MSNSMTPEAEAIWNSPGGQDILRAWMKGQQPTSKEGQEARAKLRQLSVKEKLLKEQCEKLLFPLKEQARERNESALQPTRLGALIVAALTKSNKEGLLPPVLMDAVRCIPSNQWPEDLHDAVEQALEMAEPNSAQTGW